MTMWSGMVLAFAMSWFSALWAAVPWTAAFILARRYKFRIYTLNKPDECKRVQRRVQDFSSHTTDNGKGYGWAFGYWYIIHMEVDRDGDSTVWMIASEYSYNELTKDLDDDDEDEGSEIENAIILPPPVVVEGKNAKKLHIYDRRGTYVSFYYRKRSIKSLGFIPKPEQTVIMEEIKAVYQQKGRGVFFIHGPPNTGKSIIGLLLAEYYGGNYSNTFTPWQPGNVLTDLTDEIELVREKPLVVAFDEVDVALLRVHESTIPDHKNVPTLIQDKTGWNRFLDNFQRGLFPYLILLMTSNRSSEFINSLDPSYLRKGRVDAIFELATKMD
jgi:hypothetical protein